MSGASGGWSVLWLTTNAVQLIVPIGDDGQLTSCLRPVLWLSTNAVQLTVPVGDDGQRCPAALVPGPSYDRLHMQFKIFFACGTLFSVLLLQLSVPFVKLVRLL